MALRGGQYDGGWYNRNCTAKQDGAVCERPLPGYVALPTPPVVPPGARCPDGWYEATYNCFQVKASPRLTNNIETIVRKYFHKEL